MTSKIRMTFVFILLFFIAPVLHAQSAAMEHVFPQFVDGAFGDGSTFTSRPVISSIGGFPATCSLTLFGIGPERLAGGASIEVQPASWVTVSTRGQDVIATGYALLNCSQPVFASLTYSRKRQTAQQLGSRRYLALQWLRMP